MKIFPFAKMTESVYRSTDQRSLSVSRKKVNWHSNEKKKVNISYQNPDNQIKQNAFKPGKNNICQLNSAPAKTKKYVNFIYHNSK